MSSKASTASLLHRLSKIKQPEIRSELLHRAPAPFINQVCRCTKNLLHGKVRLTPQEIKKLRSNKGDLIRIAEANTLKQKRTALKRVSNKSGQSGGFLALLASLLIPAVIEAVKK